VRPVIVESLNSYFKTTLFSWLVPELALVYAAAIAACLLTFVRRAKQIGLPEFHAWGAALSGILAGIIGVRAWYLLLNLGSVAKDPSILLETNGPTVSFGGYFFGIAASVSYLRLKKQAVLRYLDAAASCLGLGPMIARWSCFLNGDDYGRISAVPWAVQYPPGSYPFVDHVNHGLINVMADHSLPVHPVQLYLSVKGLLLFLVCSYLWRHARLLPGMLFGIFWVLYAVLRFSIEFFRGDPTINYWHFFTYGQVVCVFILIVSLLYLLVISFRARPEQYLPGQQPAKS
jgi:phosphatidylglycerol---prolipoprotein diacylglyceryl transferase